LLVT
jgi:ferritin-like metal-binding protein YciE